MERAESIKVILDDYNALDGFQKGASWPNAVLASTDNDVATRTPVCPNFGANPLAYIK